MDLVEALKRLEAQGTEQNRKVYRRHGVGDKMYGVSYAALGELRKAIKTDHSLALRLWATGNHDARILATMIMDPVQIDEAQAVALAEEVDNHIQADALANVFFGRSFAEALMIHWLNVDRENLGRLAWTLAARMAADPVREDALFTNLLPMIEGGIHTRRNRVREAMNTALITIGMRSDALEAAAVAAAGRIGKVQVDHGDTSCKTPDAITYIRKGRAHQAARLERAAHKRRSAPGK